MFDNILKLFKKIGKKEPEELTSKDMAKERLHLVLMQDRANVSADFLDMMRQEIIDVIKKYIDVDEKDIDVRLTNKMNEDGTTGAPALYANIPIAGIKQNLQNSSSKIEVNEKKNEAEEKKEENEVPKKEENSESKNKVEEDKNAKKEEKNIKEETKKGTKKEVKTQNKTKSKTKKNTKSSKK